MEHEIKQGPGVVDINIRFDTKTGEYTFSVEEAGLPTVIPLFLLSGMLNHVATQSALYVDEK